MPRHNVACVCVRPAKEHLTKQLVLLLSSNSSRTRFAACQGQQHRECVLDILTGSFHGNPFGAALLSTAGVKESQVSTRSMPCLDRSQDFGPANMGWQKSASNLAILVFRSNSPYLAQTNSMCNRCKQRMVQGEVLSSCLYPAASIRGALTQVSRQLRPNCHARKARDNAPGSGTQTKQPVTKKHS